MQISNLDLVYRGDYDSVDNFAKIKFLICDLGSRNRAQVIEYFRCTNSPYCTLVHAGSRGPKIWDDRVTHYPSLFAQGVLPGIN